MVGSKHHSPVARRMIVPLACTLIAASFVGCETPGPEETDVALRTYVAGWGSPTEYGLMLLQSADQTTSSILEMDVDAQWTGVSSSISGLANGQVPVAVAGNRLLVQAPDGEIGFYRLTASYGLVAGSYFEISGAWAATTNPTPMGFRAVDMSQAILNPHACVDPADRKYYVQLDDPTGTEQPVVWLIDEQGSIARRDGVFAVRADDVTEAVHFGVGSNSWEKQVWYRAANDGMGARDVRYDASQLGWTPVSQFITVHGLRDSVRTWFGGTHSDFTMAAYSTYVDQAGVAWDRLTYGSSGNFFIFKLSPGAVVTLQEHYLNQGNARVIHYTDVRGDCPATPPPAETPAQIMRKKFEFDPQAQSREELQQLCRRSGIRHPACERATLNF